MNRQIKSVLVVAVVSVIAVLSYVKSTAMSSPTNDERGLVRSNPATSQTEHRFTVPAFVALECRDFGPKLLSDGTGVGLFFERKVEGHFRLVIEGRGVVNDADTGQVNAIDDDGTIRMGTYDIDTGRVFTVSVWKDREGRLAFSAVGKALRPGTIDVLWIGNCVGLKGNGNW